VPIVYPCPGKGGLLHLAMYRGIKAKSDRLAEEFASDPGDYGCGEYWTDCEAHAQFYGDVSKKYISLDNVYHIPPDELMELIKTYGTCDMQSEKKTRRESSTRMTEFFKSKGYEGVLTFGYEAPDIFGLCIFDSGN
jgi:hypothetical protein